MSLEQSGRQCQQNFKQAGWIQQNDGYDAGVEFVVIGGAAMGLQGSAHLTRDIDFCYARTRRNMERLAKALEPYHPVLRGAPPGLPFRFDAKTVANGLNFRLSTDLGDLDFLGEVSGLSRG